MRLRFLGDHAAEHCGCQAVTDVITASLRAQGRIVGPDEDFDALVVNGEGSMHHGQRNWLVKMDAIRLAQAQGKRTWLINSLWDNNPVDYDDCLARLDGFWVRGAVSARDLEDRHGLQVAHHPDVSFSCPINEDATPVADLAGRIVVTDIHVPDFDFVWLPHRGRDPWTRIDMRRVGWSELVGGLRGARVLITGRHHGMYAACKARLPFIPIRGNAHKFEDLLDSARSPIPVAQRRSELEGLLGWARANRAAYDDLFDWMEEQPVWRFDPDAAEPARPTGAASHRVARPVRSLQDRANAAYIRRDHAQAAPLWRDLLAERGTHLPTPRHAARMFFGAGDVPLAMQVLARARAQQPGQITCARMLIDWAADPKVWIDRGPGPDWWTGLKQAAWLARVGDKSGSADLAAVAVRQALQAHDRAVAAAVRFLLASRLVHLALPEMGRDLYRGILLDGVAAGQDLQERLLLAGPGGWTGDGISADLAGAADLPCWADPAFRAVVLGLRLAGAGVTPDLLSATVAAARLAPDNADLRDLLYTMATEAGDWSFLPADLAGPGCFSRAALRTAARRFLGVAAMLNGAGTDPGHLARREMAERAALLTAFRGGRDRMLAQLADPALRLAVVGAGVKAQGARIDACDLVIRFSDFATGRRKAADSGQRTDIYLQSHPLTAHALAMAGGRECLIVQAQAGQVCGPRDWNPTLDAFADGQQFGFVPRVAALEAARSLGHPASAGFILLHLTHALRGGLSGVEVYGTLARTPTEAGAIAALA